MKKKRIIIIKQFRLPYSNLHICTKISREHDVTMQVVFERFSSVKHEYKYVCHGYMYIHICMSYMNMNI